MKNIQDYIRSGIIELHVLGLTSEEENAEIIELSLLHPEIRTEIDEITQSFLNFGHKLAPNNESLNLKVKPMLMATIDYTERLKHGEEPGFPHMLHEGSKAEDFTEWTSREDMGYDSDYGDAFAKIIGYTEQATTAIVWLKSGSPLEKHDREYERFLVLEGSCEIITEEKIFTLVRGDYFSIPLHVSHVIKVTSEIPCKIILQRVAA